MKNPKILGPLVLAVSAALVFTGCSSSTQEAVVPTAAAVSTHESVPLPQGQATSALDSAAEASSVTSAATVTTGTNSPTVSFAGSPITVSIPSTGYIGTSSSGVSTFSSTQAGTYLGAQPTQAGVRLLSVSRTSDPRSFPIALPDATTSVGGPSGALAFTNSSGVAIAVTSAPWAKTEDGQWLSSSLTFLDGKLVQQVTGASANQPVVAGFDFFALANVQTENDSQVLGDWLPIRTYPSTPPLLPQMVYLRDGSPTWGYQHLVKNGRWNPWFDGMMGVTVSKPNQVTADGTTQVRILKIRNCPQPYNFRVVIQKSGTKKHNVQKGIITAYQQFI